MISLSQAAGRGYFTEAGHPTGTGWDEFPFPAQDDPNCYALEVTGDRLEPAYRDGDVVIVSPAAELRRGDRLVLRSASGEVLVRQLTRLTAKRLELAALDPAQPGASLALDEVSWMARILWVSQ